MSISVKKCVRTEVRTRLAVLYVNLKYQGRLLTSFSMCRISFMSEVREYKQQFNADSCS